MIKRRGRGKNSLRAKAAVVQAKLTAQKALTVKEKKAQTEKNKAVMAVPMDPRKTYAYWLKREGKARTSHYTLTE